MPVLEVEIDRLNANNNNLEIGEEVTGWVFITLPRAEEVTVIVYFGETRLKTVTIQPTEWQQEEEENAETYAHSFTAVISPEVLTADSFARGELSITAISGDASEVNVYPLVVTLPDNDAPESVDGEEDESGINQLIKDVEKESKSKIKAESTAALEKLKDQNLEWEPNNVRVNPKTGLLEVDVTSIITAGGIDGGGSVESTSLTEQKTLDDIKNALAAEGFSIQKSRQKSDRSLLGKVTEVTRTYSLGKTASDYKSRLAKESLEALRAFDKVVSLLLAEPYLYTETKEESNAELKRIQALFNKNVLPVFYQSLEAFLLASTHVDMNKKLNERVSKSFTSGGATEGSEGKASEKASVAAVEGALGLGALAFSNPITGGLFLLGGGFTYFLSSQRDGNAQSNIERVRSGIKDLGNYFVGETIGYSANDYIRAQSTFTRLPNDDKTKNNKADIARRKALLTKIGSQLGVADEIVPAINKLLLHYFPTLECFKHFETLVHKIGVGGKLANILKQSDKAKTDLQAPLNFYSEELIGRSAYKYLEYLFAFPWRIAKFSEYDYNDLFSNNTETGKVDLVVKIISQNKPLVYKASGIGDYFSKVTMLNTQAELEYDYEKGLHKKTVGSVSDYSSRRRGYHIYNRVFSWKRDLIKAEQEQKIKFLLAVKEALVEQVIVGNAEFFYDKDEYRQFVENFSDNNIFEIMNDSAYPDIDLPSINLTFDKVKKVNPAFYYANIEERKTKKKEAAIRKKIINSCMDFKSKVRDGIVSGRPVNFDDDRFVFENLKATIFNINPADAVAAGFKGRLGTKVTIIEDDSGIIAGTQSALGIETGESIEAVAAKVQLPEFKVNLSSFKNKKEVENYVTTFQTNSTNVIEKVNALQDMFGGKIFPGLKTNVEALEWKDDKKGVGGYLKRISKNLGVSKDLQSYSSKETLVELSEKAQKDAFSTRGMQGAFPTFRLYIVEEDAIFSGKLTAYDDFYSYGSVIAFDVHSSREMAASTATIQLQNVSGILDGTKKEVENYVTTFQTNSTNVIEKVNALQDMFGGKIFPGLKTNVEALEWKDDKKGVGGYLKRISKNLGVSKDLQSYSSKETLVELSEKAQKDAFSTRGMQGAFPTFRLYIVEEDAIFSGKLTAYDDFYSYGSVIAFDVHSSREMAASTATIQLQNVSGILDGTKKEVVRDVDVDNRNIKSDKDDAYESLIESIVLRPGINIQLRAGYENDTKDLDILISGRVSDLSYSSDGMITNIIVQSYGVELEQTVQKSLAKDNSKNVFYSTHQLLGSLMLSPELKHFGRIKSGKVFQAGSTQNLSLDVRDYSNQSSFTLNYTAGFLDFLEDHALAITLGTAFIPGGIRLAGTMVSKLGFTRAIAAAISRGANLANTNLAGMPTFIKALSGATALKFMGKVLNVGQHSYKVAGRYLVAGTKPLINTTLNTIKTGGKLSDDSIALLNTIEHSLPPRVLSNIDEIVKPLGDSVKVAARQEAVIMTHIIEAEGMAFTGIKNFSSTALGNARLATRYVERPWANFLSLSSLHWGLRAPLTGLGYVAKTYAAAGVALAQLGVIGLLMDALNFVWEKTSGFVSDVWKGIFDSKKDDTLKLILSPQDDNIFPPAPDSYLRYDEEKGDWYSLRYKTWRFLGEVTDIAFFHVPYSLDNYLKTDLFNQTELIGKYYEDFAKLFDTRLVIEAHENSYVLKNQTIFNVFHEMSLRHPGYVYGARPYGQSMEYRMFFGLADQNYWAKDISMVDALRLNKILAGVNNTDELLTMDDCKVLYKAATEDLSNFSIRTNKRNEKLKAKKDFTKQPTLSENDIRTIITNHALNEYLEKTNDRFVPFRKMHSFKSSKNIVSNDITVSAHNVINTVTSHYTTAYGDKSEELYSLNLAANTAIKSANARQKVVTGENIRGPACAYRYGISELIYGAKNLYTGSVLVLGNPKINPWDLGIVNDNVNRMHGPVEVKSVTHTFSHQSGFLTNVEVNAVVTSGDDMLTYGAISSSILAEAREELYKEYSSRALFQEANTDSGGDIVYEEIIGKMVTERFPKSHYGDNVREKIKGFYIGKLKENIATARKNDEPVFLQDIISGDITLPSEIKDQISAVGDVGLVFSGTVLAGESIWASTFGKHAGLRNLRSPLGLGFMALTGAFAALSFGSDSVFGGLESSLNSGYLGKNLFRPVLFSKVSNQNLIEIYPLVKDGKPLLTGGFENIPAEQTYNNVVGNIFSMVSSAYEGMIDNLGFLNTGPQNSVLGWEDADDFVKVETGRFGQLFKNSEGLVGKNIHHHALKDN